MRLAAPARVLLVALVGCTAGDATGSSDASSGTGGMGASATGSSTDAPTSTGPDGSEGDSTGAPEDPGLFERGVIVPPNSVPCVPVTTGVPQDECNHHGSSITELTDGTIATVWYHGEFEKSLDSRLLWSRLTPDADAWSEPEVLFDDPERSEGNPAIWVSESGEILVFFVSIWGKGWDETKIRLVRSSDNGGTWSDPALLRDALCWNTRQKPIRKDDGGLILPLYLECAALPVFMHSSDDFVRDVQWTELEEMDSPPEYFAEHVGQIQPALVRLSDGRLSAITRNGTGSGHIKQMIGDPSGTQWSPSEPIELPNSGTSVDQVRLDNGHIVVIFNNSPEERFPLAAALSTDEGETYSAVRHLDDTCDRDACSYSYPSIAAASDGTLWVTYTHNRETIGWVHFDETWLAHGGDELVLP